jgi:2-oxoglutarate dehydrogenase E2 component (dihydrolipoamide succinyltransferase)
MLSRASLRLVRASPSLVRSPMRFTPRLYLRLASTVVKVPEMAESISEGTLKQFSKKVGDFVERDEEIATIETDKVSS